MTMNQVGIDERALRQYLLGELTEEKRRQLEERLITDNAMLEKLLLSEDELVDDYVRGALSSHDQEKFSRHYLCTPERRQKVEFASVLRRYVSESAAVKGQNSIA